MSFRDNIPRCTSILKGNKPCMAFRKKGFETCGKHTPKPAVIIIDDADGQEEENECPICYDNIKRDESQCQLIGCKHYFHKDCIKKWLSMKKDTCPSCRRVIDKNQASTIMGKRKRKVKTTVNAPTRSFMLVGHTDEGSLYAWIDDDGVISDDVILVT